MTDRPQGTVLTYRMVLIHAALLAGVGSVLLWLGQVYFQTRIDASITQLKVVEQMAELQTTQMLLTESVKELKEEVKELRKAR